MFDLITATWLAAYYCAGSWYAHGLVTSTSEASAEDRSYFIAGIVNLNPGAIVALFAFVSVWPFVFIWARLVRVR